MSRPTKATIDLQALDHNLNAVKRFAPRCKILAMVKADGYGHGLVRVAKGLNRADAFGVACIEEALRLREAGVEQPIVLMEGPFSGDEIAVISQHQFHLVLHHQSQLSMLLDNPPNKPIPVWLKIDSGMHRLGFSPNTVGELWQWCLQHPKIVGECRVMTHFAQAESADPSFTQKQIDCFQQCTQGVSAERSLANSAGIIGWPAAHADWIRPGIMLYGISPIDDKSGTDYGLKPVMRLQSELIAVNEVQAGDRVGYGSTWTAPEAMKIGVVAMGYGDGYPRTIANGAPIYVNGRILPLVGRISMDMLTVDCRTYPQAKVGDSVVLWGAELPVERVAKAANTIPYALVTSVTGRVPMAINP